MRYLLVLATLAALSFSAAPASASTQSFTNPTPIAIPGSGEEGPGSLYPSPVTVNGMTGPITDVDVNLRRVTHGRPVEMDVLLVSPHGTPVVLMATNCFQASLANYSWTFSQQAPIGLSPPCDGFLYRPAAAVDDPLMPPPAPAGRHSKSLDRFNGEQANGTWSLYVSDNNGHDTGDMAGGWSITVTTGSVEAAIPATGTSGKAG